MMDDLNKDETIEEEINLLFEEAERERYIHSRSKETFDYIAGLWFLDDVFQSVLAHISSNYVVSSFLLKSLALIYKRIQKDYDIQDFTSDLLTNNEQVMQFTASLENFKSDKKFLDWLQRVLLPKCKELLNYNKVNNLEDISRLGNLADSTLYIAQKYASNDDENIWICDSIFQFSDELIGITRELKASIGNIEITDPTNYLSGSSHGSKAALIILDYTKQSSNNQNNVSIVTQIAAS